MMTDSLAASMNRIPRRPVSTEVAQAVQELIASRSLRAGDRLPTERELAASLGVGRSAVREAIRYLAALDIVETRQGSGMFVKVPQRLVLLEARQIGSTDARKGLRLATEARKLVDCATVEAATRFARSDLVTALRNYLDEADSEPLRTKLARSIDLTFEGMIGARCGNPYLGALQDLAHRNFRAAWEEAGVIPRPAEERSQQHRDILEAIETGDAVEARRRMEQHFALQALEEQN